MNKEKIKECVQWTDEILTAHFQGHHHLLAEHIHKDCLWIGERAEHYLAGWNEILTRLEAEKEKRPGIVLSSKEFETAVQDRSSCVIAGRYIRTTEEGSGELYRDMQRVTFSWKEEKGRLFITHVHISNPFTAAADDEMVPHGIGKITRDYLDMLIRKEVEKSGYLIVKDRDNVIHRIQVSSILFLEAFNVNTLLHTVDGDIFARAAISALEGRIQELQQNLFVRVHKSFAVNRFCVTSIQRYELRVADEYIVPVSKAKFQEVRALLHM